MSTAPLSPAAAQPLPVSGLPDPGERVPPVAWPTLALYAGTLALFALEMYAVLAAGWSPWLTVPMGTAVTFLMFSVLHEATHHAVSTSDRLNNLMGHLSVPFVAPYGTFGMIGFIHIEHHRNRQAFSLSPCLQVWQAGQFILIHLAAQLLNGCLQLVRGHLVKVSPQVSVLAQVWITNHRAVR